MVGLRRRCNVDNVWRDFCQEIREIVINMLHMVAHGELLRHEWFSITNGHQFGVGGAGDSENVIIRGLAASDNCNPQCHDWSSWAPDLEDSSRPQAGALYPITCGEESICNCHVSTN